MTRRLLLVGLGILLLLLIAGKVVLVVRAWEQAAVRRARVEAEVAHQQERATAASRVAGQLRALGDSLRRHRDTTVVVRWRTVIDTAYLAADSTLPACLASKAALRTQCQQAQDSLAREITVARGEADHFRDADSARAASDTARQIMVDSLKALTKVKPVPTWLGFFQPTRLTAVANYEVRNRVVSVGAGYRLTPWLTVSLTYQP